MNQELLVNPFHIQHMEQLCKKGADAFLVGTAGIGIHLPAFFSIEEIQKACEIKEKYHKKLYIAINGIYHNDQLETLENYLHLLKEFSIDGVTFGDPAILMLHQKINASFPLHWSPETTATNWFSCNYWGRKGAIRAVLAPELSLDAIMEIKKRAKVEIQVQVHGMLNMFHSKRLLLDHYYQYQGKTEMFLSQYQDRMYLLDRERGANYPIYQDELGTYMLSPKDLCMIDDLDMLFDAKIDAFFLNFMFQSEAYATEITGLYREAIDLLAEDYDAYAQKRNEFLNQVKKIQPSERELDQGFFYKETVY